MSALTLHRIGNESSAKAVVFIHGVNGHWRDTWLSNATNLYWPQALADLTRWETYSVEYDANTNWDRTTMPLQERAVSIAELLRDSPELANKDIAIVAHSFGGIVTKQMLRHWSDRDRYRSVRGRIGGVVFLATPHTGADIATFGNYLKWALGSTVTLEDLRAHSPLLTDLADWFRNADVPRAHVLYETRKMKLGWFRRWLMIVNRASANPGLRDVTVVPVDADHSEITRPATASAIQFVSTLQFLRDIFAIPACLARYPKQAAAVCFRRTSKGVEFLLVRTTGGRWTFPKGGIEEERGVSGSAAQEALEEAGVTGRIAPTPFTYYLHGKREWKSDDTKAVKFCVAAFLLEVLADKAAAPERGRHPTWMSPEEAKKSLTEDRSVIYQDEFRRVIDEAVGEISRPDD